MFGVSSDRIGTPDGEAYFLTLSKDLEQLTGLPIAPYVGAAYGTLDETTRAVGGLRLRLRSRLSSTVIYDGKAVHPTVDYRFGERHVLTALWVDTRKLGLSYSIAF